MWHVLADMLEASVPEHSGRVTWRAFEDEDGASHRALTVAWLDTIKDGWTAPTLHIDATLRIDLVRHIFPQIELLDRITAAAPHQHTVQYVGKSFSKAALKEDKEIDKVFHWAVAHGRRKGGEWASWRSKGCQGKHPRKTRHSGMDAPGTSQQHSWTR